MKKLAKCLSKLEAQDLLHHCMGDGSVIPGPHFKKALAEEGILIQDAFTVMRLGTIYEEPEYDPKRGNWKYKVEGHEPGGKWLCVVFAFMTIESTFLITVFSMETRRRR